MSGKYDFSSASENVVVSRASRRGSNRARNHGDSGMSKHYQQTRESIAQQKAANEAAMKAIDEAFTQSFPEVNFNGVIESKKASQETSTTKQDIIDRIDHCKEARKKIQTDEWASYYENRGIVATEFDAADVVGKLLFDPIEKCDVVFKIRSVKQLDELERMYIAGLPVFIFDGKQGMAARIHNVVYRGTQANGYHVFKFYGDDGKVAGVIDVQEDHITYDSRYYNIIGKIAATFTVHRHNETVPTAFVKKPDGTVVEKDLRQLALKRKPVASVPFRVNSTP